ncbi:MAG: ABC transporter ATP-binding protein [Candidatus Sumerlaeota bacterium]
MPELLLETHDLARHFGGIKAVEGVDCRVEDGQIYAVIGPNGAGKTTFFNCLGGVLEPTRGEILYKGERIDGLPPHRIAGKGLARTWQTIQLFAHMSVLENVLVGCHIRGGTGFAGSILRLPRYWREERRLREEAMARLADLEIADLAREPVSRLPFLKQRRVELARALAADPALLMLDEPAAGLNTRETAELGKLIQWVRERGITIVLVEHDMSLVMEISDRVLVLDHGRPIAEGQPREVQENEKVIAVYLGTDEDEEEEEGLT